jgi:hypothetical protein
MDVFVFSSWSLHTVSIILERSECVFLSGTEPWRSSLHYRRDQDWQELAQGKADTRTFTGLLNPGCTRVSWGTSTKQNKKVFGLLPRMLSTCMSRFFLKKPLLEILLCTQSRQPHPVRVAMDSETARVKSRCHTQSLYSIIWVK